MRIAPRPSFHLAVLLLAMTARWSTAAARQPSCAFLNFNCVKTFRQTDDRDLFQLGLLTDF
jgi:hypothetical protein